MPLKGCRLRQRPATPTWLQAYPSTPSVIWEDGSKIYRVFFIDGRDYVDVDGYPSRQSPIVLIAGRRPEDHLSLSIGRQPWKRRAHIPATLLSRRPSRRCK